MITRNKLCDHFRARRDGPAAVGGSEHHTRLQDIPAELLDGDEASEELEMRLLYRRAAELIQAEWDQTSWQAFWRVTVDDQPSAAVAEELGMTANAVRMAKSRVLRRLREELGDLVH